MKYTQLRSLALTALAAGAALLTPVAQAATANLGDVFLGVRATGGDGATNDYIINLGAASQFENATAPIKPSLGNISADLTTVFSADWKTRSTIKWGIVGTVGSFNPIGTNPAKTVWATRAGTTPWNRDNDSAHGAVANKIQGMSTAFKASSSAGLVATNAVSQLASDSNSWASYSPAGTVANSGSSHVSFAFFNPDIEGDFAAGTAGSVLHFYRVKPAVTSPEIGTSGDYLGRFILNDSGELTFIPVAAFDTSTVQLAAATASVAETAGTVAVTLTRTGDTSSAATVQLSTTDGTALAGTDYTAISSQAVTFGVNEVSKSVDITIANRAGFQGDRAFTVSLAGGSGVTIGGTSQTVTISEAVTVSEINLVDASVTVTRGVATATINLVRSVGGSPVTIDIQTTDGTALAGTDYTTPTGGAQTVSFAANVNTATATITLSTTATGGNKSFTVGLTNPSANATVGTTAPLMTTVNILAADAVAPTVTISTPAVAAVLLNTNPNIISVSTSGSAADNVEVSKVLVSVNGGAPVEATLSSSGLGFTWNATLSGTDGVVGGVNTLSVVAKDAQGNTSAPATRTFTYTKKRAITTAVSPAATGTITGWTATALYEVGKIYTITAKPNATKAFNGWTGAGLSAPTNEPAVFTFVFTDAMFHSSGVTLTANFIDTPFTAGKIGAFNGLVKPSGATISSNSTNGFLNLTITPTGTFSGTMNMDGNTKISVTGLFNNTGAARFGATRASTVLVPRLGKSSLELSNVVWNSAANTISGEVKQYLRSTVIATSAFTLDRAAFSAATPVAPSSYTSTNGGKYSVIIPSKAQTNGLTLIDYAQGTGVGLITITPAGVVNFVGTLADNTPITVSAPLSSALKAPLFKDLYLTKGSFSALVALNDADGDSDLKATDCVWFRPYQSAVQWYPWGWDEGLTLDLLGAKYDPKLVGGVIPGLTAVGATVANATLAYTGPCKPPYLCAVLNANVNISATNVVTKLTGANLLPILDFSFTLTATTGDVKGDYKLTDGTKPTYIGKVYQKGVHRGAHGFSMTVKPKVVDGTGESGNVRLSKL